MKSGMAEAVEELGPEAVFLRPLLRGADTWLARSAEAGADLVFSVGA